MHIPSVLRIHLRVCALILICAALSAAAVAAQVTPYFPDASGPWERRTPEDVGMDARRLAAAIEFARASEARAPRDLAVNHALSFAREPYGEAIGPFRERGEASGVILRHGYIVAEWGDPHRVDVTFSVTKSFLSSVVGLAYDRGLIRSLDKPVRQYSAPVVSFGPLPGVALSGAGAPATPVFDPFESEHNRRITWDHLLRQTSDWEGTLWGKPDWADRPDGEPAVWLTRPRHEPGTVYKYNDVRVNVLALAALNVWRRPLPEVLREHLMEPIGASATWRWYGYDNSWIVLDGVPVQSVSGGAHWGGGMWISARDMARFGLLTLHRGRWNDRQVLSEEWIRMALTPTPAQPTYGFMNWFLNTDRQLLPSAPPSSFHHLGAGTNVIYVDPEHDLVIVARWLERDALDGFVQRVLAAVRCGGTADEAGSSMWKITPEHERSRGPGPESRARRITRRWWPVPNGRPRTGTSHGRYLGTMNSRKNDDQKERDLREQGMDEPRACRRLPARAGG